jgi:hypothetical protein
MLYSDQESDDYIFGFEDGCVCAFVREEVVPGDPMEAPYTQGRVVKEIMLWTGLKDCKGTEIYDRDIIPVGSDKHYVVWLDKMACFGLWPPCENLPPIYGADLAKACELSEVIGNIHQHAHLLEKDHADNKHT